MASKRKLKVQIDDLHLRNKEQGKRITQLEADKKSLENVLIKAGVLVEVFDPPAPEPVKYDIIRYEEPPLDPYAGLFRSYGFTPPPPMPKIVRKFVVVEPAKGKKNAR